MIRLYLVCYMLILTSVCTLLKLKALYIGVTTTTSNSMLVSLKRWFLMLNVLLPITCLLLSMVKKLPRSVSTALGSCWLSQSLHLAYSFPATVTETKCSQMVSRGLPPLYIVIWIELMRKINVNLVIKVSSLTQRHCQYMLEKLNLKYFSHLVI